MWNRKTTFQYKSIFCFSASETMEEIVISKRFLNWKDKMWNTPTKLDSRKIDLKVVLDLWNNLRYSIVNLFLQDSWNNNHKILLFLTFSKCGLPSLCCYFGNVITIGLFCFVMIKSRIILLKSGLRIKCRKIFQRPKTPFNLSCTVMFRRTSCNWLLNPVCIQI